MYDNTIDACWS